MVVELEKYLSKRDLAALLFLSHRSLRCHSEAELKKLVLDLRGLLEFENAVCAQAKIPDAFLDPKVPVDVLDVSYPTGYMDLYFENCFHLTDAVLCTFLTHLSPVNWLSLDRQYNYNYPAAVLALDYNMRDGWAYGMVNPRTSDCTAFFMGGPTAETSIRSIKILEYIIPFFSQAYTRVLKKDALPKMELSAIEREVLHWIKEGKSSWEISMILKCSKRCVDFHTNNIKSKLNAVTRPQAVAIGLQSGLIDF
ncbi:MAG: LuxR C-terminal-related transcriptional regulator [Desulfobacteraceae bacterium]|nr:LuxR C-terminal-related transcriptional regulator [Desulfobacteraceae bacterium]